MTIFPEQPKITPFLLTKAQRKTLGRRFLYRLEESFTYNWVGDDDRKYRIIVPAGFFSDGASVPPVATAVVARDGLIRAGALVHDFCFAYDGNLPAGSYMRFGAGGSEGTEYLTITWKEANRLFKRINKQAGVNPVVRWLAYRAVVIASRRW